MNEEHCTSSYKRIVIKVGTSTLVDMNGRIDRSYIESLINQIASLREAGAQVVLVSSGAITAGLEHLGFQSERPDDIPTLQAAAAVGQIELIRCYASYAEKCGIVASQILLTRSDTSNRHAYLHARDTTERLLELDTLPIVNENDTVAIEEIRFGDNDTLAATIATLINADLVILLSDIEGLYTADPRREADAELLTRVSAFTDTIIESAGGVGSKTGSGGMATKVKAARVLMKAGIPMVICEGRRAGALLDIARGEQVGTLFAGEDEGHTATARKLWIALGDSPQGALIIDDGAREALRNRGSSLLSVGVKAVEGSFAAGAVVDIRDREGRLIGRGITRHDAKTAAAAAGKNSTLLLQTAGLEALANVDIVHRDEMVVF